MRKTISHKIKKQQPGFLGSYNGGFGHYALFSINFSTLQSYIFLLKIYFYLIAYVNAAHVRSYSHIQENYKLYTIL